MHNQIYSNYNKYIGEQQYQEMIARVRGYVHQNISIIFGRDKN